MNSVNRRPLDFSYKILIAIGYMCVIPFYCAAAARLDRDVEPAIPASRPARAAEEYKSDTKEKTDAKIKAEEAVPLPYLLHDVIVILNDKHEELNAFGDLGFVVGSFCTALCQKDVPIIVSEAVLFSVFTWLYDSRGTDLYASAKGFLERELSADNWNIYAVDNLYLFIPQAYALRKRAIFDDKVKAEKINQFLKEQEKERIQLLEQEEEGFVKWSKDRPRVRALKAYTPQELFLGFPIESKDIGVEKVAIDRFKRTSDTSEEKKRIVSFFKSLSPINIDSLMHLFIPSGFWNIVMCGHGMYSKSFEIPASQLKKQSHIVSEEDAKKGFLVGLPFFDFKRFLKFMSRMPVNILEYSTCYGGSSHVVLPYTTNFLNKDNAISSDMKEAHFTIIVGSITSSVVTDKGWCSLEGCVEKKPIPLGCVNYTLFFDRVHTYSRSGDLPKRFSNEELINLAQAINVSNAESHHRAGEPKSRDLRLVGNIPLVKDPLAVTFRPLPLNKNQYVINNAVVQKHVLENNKPFEFKNAEAILISTADIPVPISIDVTPGTIAPAIVSVIPGSALIVFESVTTNSTFATFFTESMSAVRSVRTYFYFKRLTLINDAFGPHVNIDKPVHLFDVIVALDGYYMRVFFTDVNGQRYQTSAWAPEGSRLALKFNDVSRVLIESPLPKDVIPDNTFLSALVHYSGFDVSSPTWVGGIKNVLSLAEINLIEEKGRSDEIIKLLEEDITDPIAKDIKAEMKKFKEEAAKRISNP